MSQSRWFAKVATVSVLDLEQYRPNRSATCMQHRADPVLPYSGAPDDTDVSLSKRCQSCNSEELTARPSQDDGNLRPKMRLMIM